MARARSWYNPVAFAQSVAMRPRLYGAAIAGTLAATFLPHNWPQTVRLSMAWEICGAVYLFFAFRLISTCGTDRIRVRAARRDDSRIVILTIILLAIAASFAAIAGLVGQAKLLGTGPEDRLMLAGLAIVTIMTSWGVTQVAFALHYAHDFYDPEAGSDTGGGLIFPGCEKPDYWDFLYFAISVGATCQTSDTAVSSRALRRLVSVHATVAFFFNTAVLALTVNVAASLAG